MWQELCKTREEYLKRTKLNTKGYSPRRSETLLYEVARLEGMDIKKQDFFNILNGIEISPKVTRENTHRIKDLSNAFLYLIKCASRKPAWRRFPAAAPRFSTKRSVRGSARRKGVPKRGLRCTAKRTGSGFRPMRRSCTGMSKTGT